MNQKTSAGNQYKKCPDCGSDDVTVVESEAICFGPNCSWDSCKQSIDAGMMDELFALDFDALIAAQEAEFANANTELRKSDEVGAA